MFKLSESLAEIAGIHAGDGYLRNDGKRRELDISGNVEEKDYYDNHISSLFNRVFNINIKLRHFKSRNTYGFVIRNKDIIKFFHEQLSFPYGKKSRIVKTPPTILKESERVKCSFLKGFFDTDGSLSFDKRRGNYVKFKRTHHCYPRIVLTTVSKQLSKEICLILKEIGISNYLQEYKPKNDNWSKKYSVWIYGARNLELWMEKVGMSNPCKTIKYKIWKKYGFCPTNLNMEMLEKILKGEINPEECYGPVA